ncbi:MAG: uroporphyrinogen-III synthase [Reyranella sp.]|nr:uroporphyrinogen-III synthase [Reyranella sp.]
MRVLILRPEREATALAMALGERGHVPVIAPLFRLEFLHPPTDFSAALAACQAVLLTSANGARALAEASEQRGRAIFAVGDTTASTAEGLGFSDVLSAAGDAPALVELVKARLKPADGPLLHVSGREIAADLAEALAPAGFEVKRFTLYDAREETALPEPARAALEAQAIDVATFFSPRAASVFASMVEDAGLSGVLRSVTAVAISPAALAPVAGLPFKAAIAAKRPTRQAVLDEIDRLAVGPVQGEATMTDAPASPGPASEAEPTPPPPPPAPVIRRGLGVLGAFVIGLVAAVIVLAGALISLPFWPPHLRDMWRGQPAPPPTSGVDLQALRADLSTVANAAADGARRELTARLDDLEKRLRAVSATVAERPASSPAAPDPAVADLRGRVEALEKRPTEAAPSAAAPAPVVDAEKEKEIAMLTREIATLRSSISALDQAVATQRDQAKTLSDAVGAKSGNEQKALSAARAAAVIGVAARLSGSIEAGIPFANDLNLLTPLIQGDAKLAEISASLQPYAQAGVASRAALEADFPQVAKAAMAEDLSDDSYGARLVGKLRGLVSLRRVGDVPGDTTEARLARAETALHAGDLAKAVELVKSLPPQTNKATAAWLAKAEAHLAARRGLDQLAAYAVTLLGTAR